MEKFLSIPVLDGHGTNSQNQLVSVTGILSIGQPTTSSATINYIGGKVVTLQWPNQFPSPILKEAIQTASMNALKSGWTSVSDYYAPKGMVAGAAVNSSTEPNSFLNTNPLTSIVIA